MNISLMPRRILLCKIQREISKLNNLYRDYIIFHLGGCGRKKLKTEKKIIICIIFTSNVGAGNSPFQKQKKKKEKY